MKRAGAVAVLIGTAGAVAAGVAVPTSSQLVEGEGTYQLIAADLKAAGSASPVGQEHPIVRDAHGRLIPAPAARGLQPGTRVRYRTHNGKVEVSVVSAAPKTPTKTTTAAPVTTSTAAATLATTAATKQSVLVVLANWTAPDSVTQQSASSLFFTEADRWFTQASYGALGLTGTVTPWLRIAGPDKGACWAGMDQIMAQAKAAALAEGFDAASYDRTVVYFPAASAGSDCSGYAGWAEISGTQVWLNGTMDLRTAIHEQGHNLGLVHAHSYSCSDDAGLPTALSNSCTNNEYGDAADAMGAGSYVGSFQAAYKAQLGWLGTRVADLGTGGTTTLAPFESTTGVVAARITTPARTYWLEHRTVTGVDSMLTGEYAGGLLVHVQDAGIGSGAGLLAMSPTVAQLPPGGTWVTPENIAITAGTTNATGLPVNVKQVGPADVPLSLKAIVKGGKATVSWSAPADSGGLPITGYRVGLSNGTSVTVTGTSWTSTSLPRGTYTASVAALTMAGQGKAAVSATLSI